MASKQTLLPPKVKIVVDVVNPRTCTQCGRKFKPSHSSCKDEECDDCSAYLDEEERDGS